MTGREAEGSDFKPFFDLVVGILFILLILIAAQLFFTRYEDTPSPAEAAARQREALRLAQNKAVDGLLERVANELRGAGFSPAIDLLERRVTLPAAELRQEARPEATAALARILRTGVSCTAEAPVQACAGPSLARIERIAFSLREDAFAGGVPSTAARIGALKLSSQIFEAAPELLDLRTSSGNAVVTDRIGITGAQPGEAASFSIDFDAALADMPGSG